MAENFEHAQNVTANNLLMLNINLLEQPPPERNGHQ